MRETTYHADGWLFIHQRPVAQARKVIALLQQCFGLILKAPFVPVFLSLDSWNDVSISRL